MNFETELSIRVMQATDWQTVKAIYLEGIASGNATLGKAVQYVLNQWSCLSRYVDYGEMEISNCWVENQIRPFAVGRKNCLFVGNEVSANKSALLYSLIQTCKLNQIDPRGYLMFVLTFDLSHSLRSI